MGINVFAVARSIWDHEFFEEEKVFSERLAWIWLLSEAAWKPTRTRVGKYLVEVGRGQTAHSVRFLADKWNWHPSKVVRFLDRLKAEAMIETDAKQGVSVITICKYSEYQKVGLPEKTQTETVADTAPEQLRNREETGETVKQEVSTLRGSADAQPVVLVSAGSEAPSDKLVYQLGRSVLGASAGGQITKLRKACNYDDVLATQILREASDKADPKAWIAKRLGDVADLPYRSVINGPAPDAPPLKTRADIEAERAERELYRLVH